MKILLDTNAYVELRRGSPGVARLVRRCERIVFSPIVVGELLHGFRSGARYEENLEELHAFVDSPYVDVLPVTIVTADRFARISAGLRRKGRPIPTNDIWIAGQAMESGADLVSLDGHFAEVEGLVWVCPR